jgi:DNA-binding MarR family transcriptional regulator/GNAT superfamily N-acetyltransferase
VTTPNPAARIAAVRRFNRFYTRQIGVLQEKPYQGAFSLTELRVLYELSNASNLTATDLTRLLGLDAGYTSRILRRFEQRGLIRRTVSETDARQSHVELTAKGRRTFEPLNTASENHVLSMLSRLGETDQDRLVQAMNVIEHALEPGAAPKVPYILRPPQPGDMGWVVHRHGVLYTKEYGWNDQFEGLVADIIAKFMRNPDSKRERCWIAERDGEIAGCVFLMKDSDEVSRLRLLLVEPSARGLGIGARLVKECIDFAKRSGYRRMVLWTNDVLGSARRIYEAEGFKLVKEARHRMFGPELNGQDWELDWSKQAGQ